MEAYHAAVTHPETIPFNSDAHTQYDVWSNGTGHVARLWAASALPNTEAGPEITPLYAAQAFLQSLSGWRYPDSDIPVLSADADLRAEIASWHRQTLERVYGRAFDLPDALLIDTISYFMFPHCVFFLTEFSPMVFAFTPHSKDPNLSYFEIRMLMPVKEGAPRPPKAPRVEMAIDDRFLDDEALATVFSLVGLVLDQDTDIMSLIQKGARASDPGLGRSQLAGDQELIVRCWNALLDQSVGAAGHPLRNAEA